MKINTIISFDGTRMALAGKSDGGDRILLSPLMAPVLPHAWERYVKKLESFQRKQQNGNKIIPDEVHDGISGAQNLELYQLLTEKMFHWPFDNYPGNQASTLAKGTAQFSKAEVTEQIDCLLNIIQMMRPGSDAVDLTACGGAKNAGSKKCSGKISIWKKTYSDVRIIDESPSGLFSKTSENLLDLL